jgi:hypothetical protein
VRRSRNSSSKRVFPIPAGARMLTSEGRRSENARRATSSSCASSASRPMSGIRMRRGATRARTAAAETPLRFPLASTLRGAAKVNARAAARAVRSPQSTCQGSAACWSRAAMFTASPVTRKSPAASSWDATTSPVFRPRRRGSRSPSLESARTRSRSSSPAEIARSASSPCATGSPKTAITESPMNFSTVPPCVATTSFAMA